MSVQVRSAVVNNAAAADILLLLLFVVVADVAVAAAAMTFVDIVALLLSFCFVVDAVKLMVFFWLLLYLQLLHV